MSKVLKIYQTEDYYYPLRYLDQIILFSIIYFRNTVGIVRSTLPHTTEILVNITTYIPLVQGL